MKARYLIGTGFVLSMLLVGAISSIMLLTARHTDDIAATDRAILRVVTASYESQAKRSDVADIAIRLDDARSKLDVVAGISDRVDDVRGKLDMMVGHTMSRREAALRTIRAIGDRPFLLVIGDSLTEMAPLPADVCKMPLVNLGIGGARVSDFVPIVEDVLATGARPFATVIALGINDTQARFWTPGKPVQFAAAYRHLVELLPNTVMLSSITPVDRSRQMAARFSKPAWRAIDGQIRSLSASLQLPLIDQAGELSGGDTIDGVHLSPSGYLPWTDRIVAGLQKKAGC